MNRARIRIIILAITSFVSVNTAQAVEPQLLHIRVNGKKIIGDLHVPDADYDITAVTGPTGVVGLHVKGENTDHWKTDTIVTVEEMRGLNKDFVKTKLPGSPYAFSAKCAANFSASKGGVVRLHALSDWKFIGIHYGYKDYDVQIENETGAVRASLVGKNGKLEKVTKLTVNVGYLGASFTTE